MDGLAEVQQSDVVQPAVEGGRVQLAVAQPERLHWHVENRLHWVRDVTFAEDAGLSDWRLCRTFGGNGP